MRSPLRSRQSSVYCMHSLSLSLSLNTKNRRLFVLNERMWRERERCTMSRLSLNYTVCSFVLSIFFLLFPLSPSFFSHFFSLSLVLQGNRGKMELCYLFSLIILVIYDGGRHLIEIASVHARTHSFFLLLLFARAHTHTLMSD